MPLIERALAALKRIVIVIVIAIAFSVGLLGAIVLSLHSSQTTVPSIVGKDRAAAEEAITAARLNFRVRATRPASDVKPDTVLIQIPGAGEEVKVGQTVAVDISRPAKEGETPASATTDNNIDTKSDSGNANDSASSNANATKPKRNKNTNKNANDNQNANDNRNRATNSNANRAATGNQNLSPTGTQGNTNGNSNTRRAGANNNRGNSNSNTNRRRPLAAPTP